MAYLNLFESWKKKLEDNGIALTQTKWVLAISGGIDSCALLHLCADLIAFYGTEVVAVHCDHQLRGQVGFTESDLVKSWCQKLGMTFQRKTLDVESFAENTKCSIQEAARVLRRAALLETMAEVNAQWILTAHHASDRVETFLMRLLRGSGMQGLSSMSYQWRPWLKPLLPFSRREIEDYVKEKGIPFVEDPSNEGADYLRNRVRHQLLPFLSEIANADVEPLILRSVENLQDDAEALMAAARLEFDRWAIRRAQEVHLPWHRLQELPWSLRIRLLQLAYSTVLEMRRNSFDHTLERRHFEIIERMEREHELPHGVVAIKHQGDLILRDVWTKSIPSIARSYLLSIPGVTDLDDYHFRCVVVTQPLKPKSTPWKDASPFSAFIDWTTGGGNIRVRRVAEDDSISLSATERVSCLGWLKKNQVREDLRREALVFEDDKGIIWLAPYRVDFHRFVGSQTRVLLKLQLRPLKEMGKTSSVQRKLKDSGLSR